MTAIREVEIKNTRKYGTTDECVRAFLLKQPINLKVRPSGAQGGDYLTRPSACELRDGQLYRQGVPFAKWLVWKGIEYILMDNDQPRAQWGYAGPTRLILRYLWQTKNDAPYEPAEIIYVSGTILSQTNFPFRCTLFDLQAENILAFSKESWISAVKTPAAIFHWDSLKPSERTPYIGEGDFIEDSPHLVNPPDGVIGRMHVTGGVVLNKDGHIVVCSIDEGRYFCSQLPAEVEASTIETVTDALNHLVPVQVKLFQAEHSDKTVLRQGEWFFVPVLDKAGNCVFVKDFKKPVLIEYDRTGIIAGTFGQFDLPARPNANHHLISHALWTSADKVLFINGGFIAAGTVRHVRSWDNNLTGEHKTLKLGKFLYYAYRNTEQMSWQAAGKVD